MPLLPSFPFPARFAVVAMLGVLAACTRQPAPAEPPAALLANPLASVPAGVSRQPLPEQWWALFQDPQLNHWVQQALAHNQDLAQAEANERQAQARLRGLRSTGRLAAQANVTQAESVLVAARADLNRTQGLVGQGFLSQSRLDEARRAVAVAQAQLELPQQWIITGLP